MSNVILCRNSVEPESYHGHLKCINIYQSLGLFSRLFLFSRKIGFDISCKFCMKCQILFSGKKKKRKEKKDMSKCRLLKYFPACWVSHHICPEFTSRTDIPEQNWRLVTKTCLYNVDPLKPHFHIVKLGFTEVYIIFLFLLKKKIVGTR